MHLRLAEVLGRHASEVFKAMSGLEPLGPEIAEAGPGAGPLHPMGARVDFHGRDASGAPWSGFFVCAFATLAAARDVASAIAAKLGVEVADDPEGVDGVLGEYLNIVIGLTCSDWAVGGLETVFDPPLPLAATTDGGVPPRSRSFHLAMAIEGHPSMSLFLVLAPSDPGEAR
jgi:hypothetical protein